jgi:hypothetical protein
MVRNFIYVVTHIHKELVFEIIVLIFLFYLLKVLEIAKYLKARIKTPPCAIGCRKLNFFTCIGSSNGGTILNILHYIFME